MAHNYLIAIGGTGARCLEAFVYLAAAGLTNNSAFDLLIVDADQNNGNGSISNQLIGNYIALQNLAQPAAPRHKRGTGIGKHRLSNPVLFQSQLNRGRVNDTRWKNPNSSDLKFGQLIKYGDQPKELQGFLNLFYAPNELTLGLRDGYIGKPNIGSVALKQALQGSILQGSSIYDFFKSLNSDLQSGESRIFVFGSVFGGTGAAGLPTIPALIENLPDNGVIARENRERLRYGCAMLAPYFTFPRRAGNGSDPETDSAKHAIATQAALLHYAQNPPNYQHVYLMGDPLRPMTNTRHVSGGEEQANTPHYIEIVAALAAIDFFSLPAFAADTRQLHYADTSKQKQEDRGVDWDTLPVSPFRAHEREHVKARLTSFTTFAYLFEHLLYEPFVNYQVYKNANWYLKNFRDLTLEDQDTELGLLFQFVSSYNRWLRELGPTCQKDGDESRLFNWNAFEDGYNDDVRRSNLGNLIPAIAPPKSAEAGWERILEILSSIRIAPPLPNSATGLLIYLLNEAVTQYCQKNYLFRN